MFACAPAATLCSSQRNYNCSSSTHDAGRCFLAMVVTLDVDDVTAVQRRSSSRGNKHMSTNNSSSHKVPNGTADNVHCFPYNVDVSGTAGKCVQKIGAPQPRSAYQLCGLISSNTVMHRFPWALSKKDLNTSSSLIPVVNITPRADELPNLYT